MSDDLLNSEVSKPNVQGFLCCDKPTEMTSRDLVNIVTGRINAGIPRRLRTKVGHCGTLDPLATGVLVIGVGAGVRLTSFVGEQAKHYQATFRLGQSTLSGDLEGEVTRHDDLPIPDRPTLESSASRLVGDITQVPPAHSAIKVDGVRAYKRAHAGKSVEMPARQVRVDSIEITRYQAPEFDADIICGGGTYIRTLGMDIAKGAGTVAVMSSLRRVGVGPFRIDDAVTIEQIRDNSVELPIQPIVQGVAHRQSIQVTVDESIRLGHGMPIEWGDDIPDDGETEVPAIEPSGQLRAIVHRRQGMWYPKRVFPLVEVS